MRQRFDLSPFLLNLRLWHLTDQDYGTVLLHGETDVAWMPERLGHCLGPGQSRNGLGTVASSGNLDNPSITLSIRLIRLPEASIQAGTSSAVWG